MENHFGNTRLRFFQVVEARISISNLSANERIIVHVDVDTIKKGGRRNVGSSFGFGSKFEREIV